MFACWIAGSLIGCLRVIFFLMLENVSADGAGEEEREHGRKNAAKEEEEDKEMEEAFEKWKSKSYSLTVPLRVVALRGSVPPPWIKVCYFGLYLSNLGSKFGEMEMDAVFLPMIWANMPVVCYVVEFSCLMCRNLCYPKGRE